MADLLDRIALARDTLDRADARSAERELFLEKLNNAFDKIMRRLDSGFDKVVSSVNRPVDAIEGKLDVLTEDLRSLDEALQKDTADESEGRDTADKQILDNLSSLQSLVEIVRSAVGAIPTTHPVMPPVPVPQPVDLSGLYARLDELNKKLDEPMVAEMAEQPASVLRGKRIYTIKTHPNGMPSMVIAEDQFDG